VRRDSTSKRLGSLSRGPIESGVGVRDAMAGGNNTARGVVGSECVRAARGVLVSIVEHDVPED
jgi:hypothetical protein